MAVQKIFLSHMAADSKEAARFKSIVEKHGLTVFSAEDMQPGVELLNWMTSVLSDCDIVVVLVGPETRHSHWVDREIEQGTATRESGPSAGLLGVVLKTHPDFEKPYYDPINVPLRLHDRVQWEYGIVRKWSEDPDEVLLWLEEADRRRMHFQPATSLRALRELRRFPWNESLDEQRPLKAWLELEP